MKINIIFPLVLLYILPFVLHFQATQGKSLLLQHINATNSSTSSPWLTRLNNRRPRPPPGCWLRPWICSQGQPPRARRLCCRNRCVDVSSDVNNCGLCGTRCRFTRQCCRGRCVNTNRNRRHCGRCDHRCRFPSRCVYGMCGYAQPFPFLPAGRSRRCLALLAAGGVDRRRRGGDNNKLSLPSRIRLVSVLSIAFV